MDQSTPTAWPPPSVAPVPRPVAPKPVETEQERLLRVLADLHVRHVRRRAIGKRLNEIGDARPGVGVRLDGTPDINWLPVAPGGQLYIEDYGAFQVPPFYIARYPITYAQYEAFVQAKDGYPKPQWWQGMPQEYQRKPADQYLKGGNNPRDNVSWYQSVAFSCWLNSRLQGWEFNGPGNVGGPKLVVGQNAEVHLPLEWEWQWAAQGEGAARTWGMRSNRPKTTAKTAMLTFIINLLNILFFREVNWTR